MFFEDIIIESARFTNFLRQISHDFGKKRSTERRSRSLSIDKMYAGHRLHVIGWMFKAWHRSLETLWLERDGLPAFRRLYHFAASRSSAVFALTTELSETLEIPWVRHDSAGCIQPTAWSFLQSRVVFGDRWTICWISYFEFTSYIPSKPSSYGVKIIWLNQASTGYALSKLPYTLVQRFIQKKKIQHEFIRGIHHESCFFLLGKRTQ